MRPPRSFALACIIAATHAAAIAQTAGAQAGPFQIVDERPGHLRSTAAAAADPSRASPWATSDLEIVQSVFDQRGVAHLAGRRVALKKIDIEVVDGAVVDMSARRQQQAERMGTPPGVAVVGRAMDRLLGLDQAVSKTIRASVTVSVDGQPFTGKSEVQGVTSRMIIPHLSQEVLRDASREAWAETLPPIAPPRQ